MTVFNLTATTKLETTECCACGVTFAVPVDFLANKRKMGTKFLCPNGHSLFFGDDELDKAKKALAAEQTRRAQAEAHAKDEERRGDRLYDENAALGRRISAQRGVTTRMKNRVSKGVCPCCNRHFVNLERHMKGQHPDFTKEGEEE